MMKDSFLFKLLFRPGEAFEALNSGAAGWGWPLGLFALSAASSAALLAWAPPDFLAASGTALPDAGNGGFGFYLAAGLAAGVLFSAFACALLAGFSEALASGRLMLRVPLPAAAVAAYAFFFAARRGAAPPGTVGWLVAAAAAGLTAWAAFRARRGMPALLKAFLAVSAFTVLSDACGAAAALAGSASFYTGAQYFFSFVSIAWLVKASAVLRGISSPRALAAAVPALLGAAAFAFSLAALGVLPPKLFQLVLLM